MTIAAIRQALRSIDTHTHRGRAMHVLANALEHGVGAVPPQVPQATVDDVLSKLSETSERDDLVLRGIAGAAVSRNGAAEFNLRPASISCIADTALRDIANYAAALTPE